MAQWHREYLGEGAQVSVSLRELRTLRYELDRGPTEDRGYIVVLDVRQDDLSAYFPPGNCLIAQAVDAVPCSPPSVGTPRFYELSREAFPIAPTIVEGLL